MVERRPTAAELLARKRDPVAHARLSLAAAVALAAVATGVYWIAPEWVSYVVMSGAVQAYATWRYWCGRQDETTYRSAIEQLVDLEERRNGGG